MAIDTPGTRSDLAPALEVQHVGKTYISRRHRIEAVGDLDFAVRSGEFVCIVGPSGAGKTTILRCIAGLLAPTTGAIFLGGSRVDGPPTDLAVVFQEYGRSLFPWMTVRQNIEAPLKAKGLARSERDRIASEAIAAVGLDGSGDSYPWQLSGGMQQRTAIARAVAFEPKVLLMDEPFAAVDAQTRADLEDLVRNVWERLGVTVVFVTHDIDEAVYLGDRVLVLSKSPTYVLDDITVPLPQQRDQLATRSLPEFADLRARVYARIQEAKKRNPSELVETA
ncbi:MAG: ABC transporter ATP-binding protein [Microbacterium sp.]|uniref:ABC transporter ATP-binding protein n=1 Tax=Microbacterium sp. TaxID=51671 RepID=UPI00271A60B8|nr:ABC transporter ATP-binding protein [Microbacterium sp.]MDO8383535.1 ABC transporter ATP-binding protein [Microbacterium sp.]